MDVVCLTTMYSRRIVKIIKKSVKVKIKEQKHYLIKKRYHVTFYFYFYSKKI